MFNLILFLYCLIGTISAIYVLGVRSSEDENFDLGDEAIFIVISFSLIAIFFAIPMFISRLKKGKTK